MAFSVTTNNRFDLFADDDDNENPDDLVTKRQQQAAAAEERKRNDSGSKSARVKTGAKQGPTKVQTQPSTTVKQSPVNEASASSTDGVFVESTLLGALDR